MQADLRLVVDFGAQYAQLSARRVREAKVYSEIVPHTMSVDEMMARGPAAIILSGGPTSVYAPGAPRTDPDLFAAHVPVLGLGSGFRAMADPRGGPVAPTGGWGFGPRMWQVGKAGVLLRGLPGSQRVWR